jgi:hypothetical protein
VRLSPGKKQLKTKKKSKYNGQQQKEMDCDEPHLALNEETQPIQWTKRPTGALAAVLGSLWPIQYQFVKSFLPNKYQCK